MPGLYSRYHRVVHTVGDFISLTSSVAIASLIVEGRIESFFEPVQLRFYLFSLFAWFLCTALLGTYKISRVTNILKLALESLKAVALYILLTEATLNILNVESLPRLLLVYHYLLFALQIILLRALITYIIQYLRKKGYNYKNVIIVGYSKAALELKSFFHSNPEFGYRLLGMFDDTVRNDMNVVGTVKDIEQFVIKHGVDEIYCCPFELQKDQVLRLLEFVDNNLVRMKFLPEAGSFPSRKLKVDFYDFHPILIVRSIPLDDAINKGIKRFFDLSFSFVVITLLLSWLLPLLALIIKLDSKGPVFFMQERSGIDNKKFTCIKLRTMYTNSEANQKQASRGDSRITPIGAFLRKTSLDELPQFFNVFLGQMSVVGPRPHMLKHTQEYSLLVDKFMVRHFIKPGITGLSQVRGFRGDTSEVYQMRGRVKLDIFYLENWSFALDLKIIIRTVLNVIIGDKHAF